VGLTHTIASSGAFARWRLFAGSRSALFLVGIWAFTEAIAWPIIPDFILLPLALAVPAKWLAFTVVAVGGSVSGGIVSYLLGATALGPDLLDAVPLVTDSMKDAARSALEGSGALGLMSQPLSGIPYKVFAYQSAPVGVGIIEYIVMSALVRGGRFLAVALIGAAAGNLLHKVWEHLWPWFCLFYSLAFTVGLMRVVSGWR
jgi:1-acyl-sn-glycerol-3-phosphate acyltransferase